MRPRFIRPQPNSTLLRYGAALCSVIIAALLTAILSSILYPTIFPLFYVAVVFSAWYGGFKPGAVATALSVLAVYLIFKGNRDGADLFINTRLGIFVLLSLLISWLSTAFDRGLNAVREREKWFQEIFEGSRDAIFLVQSDAKFVEANRAACELTGYAREELLSMRIPDLHDDEDLHAFRNYFDSIMNGQGVISEAFIRRKDGIKVPVEFSNSRMTFRGKPVMHTTARNITERKRAEEALAQSEIRLRAIVEAEPECVKLLGLSGQLLEMNPAGLAMIEADSLDQVRDAKVADIVAPEYRADFNALTEKVLGGGAGALEFEIIGLKGTRRWLETHAVPLRDQRGEVSALLGVTRDITERKHAEEKLRARERQLATAQHVAHLGHWEWNIEDNKVTWSDELYHIFGLRPQEFDVTYETFLDHLHPFDQEFVQDVIGTALRDHHPFDFDYRIVRPDGTVRTLHGRGEVIVDENGRAVKMIGIGQDITERKRAEQALQESEKRYKGLADSAFHGVMIHQEREIKDVNLAYAEMFGYEVRELIGQDVLTLTPPEQRDWVLSKIEAERETPYEALGLRKDGSHIIIEVSAKSCLYEGKPARLAAVRDITKRKQDEEALRRAEEKYHSIFENAVEGIFQSTPEGKFISINPAMARMYGYQSPEEMIAERTDIGQQHYADPQSRITLKRLLEESDLVEGFEAQVYRRDGSKIWTSENVRAVRDGRGALLYFEGTIEDITKRKHAEEAREQLLKAREHLLRRLVTAQEEERRRIARELHDQLGQQITALILGLKWLKDSGYCQPQATEYLSHLQEYTDQLGQAVHSIAWELRPTALDDLGLHTALGNYLEKWSERSGKAVQFHLNGFNGQRLSTQIETTIYRIIQEALTNVLKHARAECISLILERRNNHVLAILEDDGCGFDVEAVINATESERKLGLLGMRERLALVFGTLDIESTPGAGTTLFVRIPVPPLSMEVSH
ncbi:MAG TPA: PAS domain S-box protein [Pyrinomonadaceae bacterium]